MRKSVYRLCIATLLAIILSVPAWAVTRYVSATGAGQYSTLTAANNAAANGDTILVGPGNFTEASGINQQTRLVWIGADWDQTIVNTGSYWLLNSSGSNHSEIQGIRVEAASTAIYCFNGADSIVLRRCLLHASSGSVILGTSSTGRFYVEECVLLEDGNSDIISLPNAATLIRGSILALTSANTTANAISNVNGTSGTVELYNNIFLSLSRIFTIAAGGQAVIAINNAFYAWGTSPTFGTYPGNSTFDYNASNGPAVPGTDGVVISGNPYVNFPGPFYVIGTSDLHLVNGSNMINAGHPSLLDIDGSRSDIGVFGGPKPLVVNGVPNYPWAVNITLTPNLVGQGTPVNATATGRVGPQY